MANSEQVKSDLDQQLFDELMALVDKYDDLYIEQAGTEEAVPDSLYEIFIHAICGLRLNGWDTEDLVEDTQFYGDNFLKEPSDESSI